MTISYFFPGLSTEDSIALEGSGCICALARIKDEVGYIINECDRETVLRLLNLKWDRTDWSGVPGVARVAYSRSGASAVQLQQSSPANANSMEALHNVLAQVQKLQAQASLTEPERIERLRLQGEVQSKQKDLEAATQRLKSTVAIFDQTATRIRTIAEIADSLGTEMAALPADLQSQCGAVNEHLTGLAVKLTELANSCHSDKTAALEVVEQKRADLQAAKQALVADIDKRRVSAEDALLDADAALSEAERVSSVQE